jgi:PAS domain-containing protein
MANRDNPPHGLDSEPVIPVEGLIETLHEPLLVLDAELRVLAASSAFGRMFRIPREETIDRVVFELGNGRWDFPALHKLLEDVLPQRSEVHGYRIEHEFECPGGSSSFSTSAASTMPGLAGTSSS